MDQTAMKQFIYKKLRHKSFEQNKKIKIKKKH